MSHGHIYFYLYFCDKEAGIPYMAVCSRVRVARSVVFCVGFCMSFFVCFFVVVLFHLIIVLSVL